MPVFHGIEMLTALDKIVQPSRTAVVVIGLQNDVCAEGGYLHGKGVEIVRVRDAIPPTVQLVNLARSLRIPVVFVQRFLDPKRSVSRSWLEYVSTSLGLESPDELHDAFLVPSTWGIEMVAELSVRRHELVVRASRGSAFFETDLDQILRCAGIESIVCAGTPTEGEIDATVRDALLRDYYAVVLEDCVSSFRPELQGMALRLLRDRTDVVISNDVVMVWDRSPSPETPNVPVRTP